MQNSTFNNRYTGGNMKFGEIWYIPFASHEQKMPEKSKTIPRPAQTHCASLNLGLCMALQYTEQLWYLTFKPSAFGKRFSSGTSTSSIWISPVLDIRRENFPSILGVSSPFDFLSTMNPLTLSSSQTAQIIQMSAIGALVILWMIYIYTYIYGKKPWMLNYWWWYCSHIFGYDNRGVNPSLQASLQRKHSYFVKNTSPLVATLYVFRLQKVWSVADL